MNKKIFFTSICLNVIFVLVSCAFLYHKRDNIRDKVNQFRYFKSESEVEKLAKAMNQEVWEPRFETLNNPKADTTIKIAFVGNSLTFHAVAENVDWKRECGMAASSLENDYVHKTVKKISENKNVSVEFAVANAANFERGFWDFDFSRTKKLHDFNADYVVFQLGENVSKDNLNDNYEVFVAQYEKLIDTVCNEMATKIVCLPFWNVPAKNQAITRVALETHSYVADLSHLGDNVDVRNYASSEADYQHAGVGHHPGDFGMENISDMIFSIFNVIIE